MDEATPTRRLRIEIEGSVQGVGFRPFVHRRAAALGLSGYVANDARGVVIEAQGAPAALERLLEILRGELPAPAAIERLDRREVPPAAPAPFAIRDSDATGLRSAPLAADLATCADCLAELFDPADRRHRYPFINCTRCGPRLSIATGLPYDRPRTTMRGFTLCAACRAEYDDPADRRFHAQPIACPACGPRLEFQDRAGRPAAREDAALRRAAAAIRAGEIVALQGLGGFQLVLDARDAAALARLRCAKTRPDKPLALMAADLEQARRLARIDAEQARRLAAPEAPIVLLPRQSGAPVHELVAPGSPTLGIMLACTPLHHLLLRDLGFPIVATSGNLRDEPICIDPREAVERLAGMADAFLVHDRPIARAVDDSVVCGRGATSTILRRARGFAPRPLRRPAGGAALLAVGAQRKSTAALGLAEWIFVSQHIGDMETPQGRAVFERVVADFLELYGAAPAAIAHDLHPDYATTHWARRAADGREGPPALAGLPAIAVQHHHAHLAACLADAGEPGPALGVILDGAGYGPDGTVWGGEFLLGDAAHVRRVASLRPFRLPGGEAAVREPRRVALALLFEAGGREALDREDLPPVAAFAPAERAVLARMIERGVEAPWTTSAGRLFDGVAALAGLHPRATFEGQAALALEWLADPSIAQAYPFALEESAPDGLVLDWRPLIRAVAADARRGVPAPAIAARWHNALVEMIVAVALRVGPPAVALSGGCFQNALLLERTAAALAARGFPVRLHRRVPPNDGGIALGQVAVAAARLARGEAGSG